MPFGTLNDAAVDVHIGSCLWTWLPFSWAHREVELLAHTAALGLPEEPPDTPQPPAAHPGLMSPDTCRLFGYHGHAGGRGVASLWWF